MAFETKCGHIVWSRDYSIKDFLSAYGKKLPQVVKMTQGFHGDYFVDSISANEILRVHIHSQQKRVVGQDKYGQPLSLPVDFALPLQLVVDNQLASPPCTLKAMLKIMELPFKVRLSNVTPMTGDKEDFGVFRLEWEFEQGHLLVNCVLDDKLEPRVRMVPSSLSAVRLAVAKGFDDKSMDWKKFLSQLNEEADTLDYNGISGGSDIAMYAAEALNSGKVTYENLVPNKFFSVHSGSVRKKKETTLEMPALGLLKMVSGKLNKSPSNASERGVPSGHYETIRFPNAPGDSNCLPFTHLYENRSLWPKMDIHGSEEQDEWDSEEEWPDIPPPPLPRTIRDKPHPDRVTRELPDEPFVYSFRRKPATPETTSSPPPGLPPRPAAKAGARPRSSSESDALPEGRPSSSGPESTNQISTWQEVPSDLSSLSVDQVTQCLQLLKLDQATIELFRQKELDGTFLTLLSEDKLREFLQNDTSLSVIDKEKTVNFVKQKWRPISENNRI